MCVSPSHCPSFPVSLYYYNTFVIIFFAITPLYTRSDTVIIINWTTAVIHKNVCVYVAMFLFKLFLSLYVKEREGKRGGGREGEDTVK